MAEQALQQAMRLEPGNPSNVLLMSNLGMIQFYDGRTDEALSTLTHAHNMAPKSVTVLMNRARIYTSTYQPKLAEADYNTVISLDSTLIEPRFYRAMITLNSGNIEAAKAVGTVVAQRALEKGIKEVVFDRGGYLYHGRVAALAEAAREAGLEF